MNKLSYVGLIIGTVVGLGFSIIQPGVSAFQGEFYNLLPIPLGMIGYGVGALFGTNTATPGNKN